MTQNMQQQTTYHPREPDLVFVDYGVTYEIRHVHTGELRAILAGIGSAWRQHAPWKLNAWTQFARQV